MPSKYGPTRTTVEHVDRAKCPGRPSAHDPQRVGTHKAAKLHGCRCPDAVEAWRIYRKRVETGRHIPRLVDPTGTRRRIQALACLGYSPTAIAGNIGSGRNLDKIRMKPVTYVTIEVRNHVTEFYRKHADKPLPANARTTQVRNTAKKMRWAPPIAWDDDLIDLPHATPQHEAADAGTEDPNEDIDVELLVLGRSKINVNTRFTRLGPAGERRARLNIKAMRILADRGLNNTQIAKRLLLEERTIERYWKRLREEETSTGADDTINQVETTPSANATPKEATAA